MKDKTKRAWNFTDLTGQVFTYLTVIKYVGTKKKKAHWLCKCECGKELIVSTGSLNTGSTKSCGCWRSERSFEQLLKHGFTTGTKFQKQFYGVYYGMKARCFNLKHKDYKNYGGRGISIDPLWLGEHGFDNFVTSLWNEYEKRRKNEEKISLDRIDVNGNYSPFNCKWSTGKEQSHNTRISVVSDNYDDHCYWRNYLGSTLSNLIRTNCKRSKVMAPYLDCSLLEFRKHIESLWLPSMSWDNYGYGYGKWNIDHIRGCNNFDLSYEKDRYICFNYLNLQPLWAVEHMSKSKILIPA